MREEYIIEECASIERKYNMS